MPKDSDWIRRTDAHKWISAINGADRVDGEIWDWLIDSNDRFRDVPARREVRNVGNATGESWTFADGSAVVDGHGAWDLGKIAFISDTVAITGHPFPNAQRREHRSIIDIEAGIAGVIGTQRIPVSAVCVCRVNRFHCNPVA